MAHAPSRRRRCANDRVSEAWRASRTHRPNSAQLYATDANGNQLGGVAWNSGVFGTGIAVQINSTYTPHAEVRRRVPGLLDRAVMAGDHFHSHPEFAAVVRLQAFHPWLSVLSSLVFTAAMRAIAARQFTQTDPSVEGFFRLKVFAATPSRFLARFRQAPR